MKMETLDEILIELQKMKNKITDLQVIFNEMADKEMDKRDEL